MLKKNLQNEYDQLVKEDILTHKRVRNVGAATERQLQWRYILLKTTK